MKSERHKSCIRRLSRIEGQVRGIQRMVAEGRYCIDILTQMQAVQAALRKAESALLKAHAEACIEEAIENGNPAIQQEKFEELVNLFDRGKR